MMVQYFNDHRPFDPPHKYEHLYDNTRIPEPGTFWDDYSDRASAANRARMRIEDMPDFNPPSDLTRRQRKQWNYHQAARVHLAGHVQFDHPVNRMKAASAPLVDDGLASPMPTQGCFGYGLGGEIAEALGDAGEIAGKEWRWSAGGGSRRMTLAVDEIG